MKIQGDESMEIEHVIKRKIYDPKKSSMKNPLFKVERPQQILKLESKGPKRMYGC